MEGHVAAQWSPSAWFLATPPQPRSTAVERPRLSSVFDQAAAAGITGVVLAPPGYGKTTALAGWASQTSRPVAWLTVTHDDHTTVQLVAGLVTALHTLGRTKPALACLLDIIPDADDASLTLDRLCRVVHDAPAPITIVIDDAHRAKRTLVDDIITVVLSRSAANAQFFVSGTRHLAEWLSRPLAMGDALLIGPDALAMTNAEVTQLAASHTESATSEATIAHILDQTGGWPIATRIAITAPHETARSHGELSTDDEILTEYISQSVLAALPDDLFDFVLATTTCSRVDAALAQALSGRADAGILLNQCVDLGLFLDRYVQEDASPVYRWHDVFARHCRILLRREQPERALRLDIIAATRLASIYPAEAILHAINAGDSDRAVRIIHDNWLQLVVNTGAATLNARCLALGTPHADRPDILLIRACCLDVQGDAAGAKRLYAQAQSVLSTSPPMSAETSFVCAFADLFLAHDYSALAAAADRVHAALTTTVATSAAQPYALFLLGWVELRLRRDPAGAVRLLSTAHRDAQATGQTTLARRAQANLGFAYAYGGLFTQSRQFSSDTAEASGEAEWHHYDGGIEFVTRGFVDLWQANLEDAQAHFRALITHGGHPRSYTALARVFHCLAVAATGNAHRIAEAADLVAGISDVEAHGVAWPAYRRIAAASLAAASRDYARALTLMQPLLEMRTIPVTSALAAAIYRRAGRPDLALTSLARITTAERVSYVEVSALVTTAVIHHRDGDRHRAHATLERALNAAESERIVLPFVCAADDHDLRDLITAHAAWGTAHEAFLAAHVVAPHMGAERNQLVGAALSRREREIFGYLATTMTADEIAAALHVSVNTVRTHQRSIYRKLGVSTRRDAVKFRL